MKGDENDEISSSRISFYIPRLLTIASNDMERVHQDDPDEIPAMANLKVDANNSSTPTSSVVVKMDTTRNSSLEINKDGDKMCRICHGGEIKSEKLITPCLCSGSMKYAHGKCLLQWLTIKQSRTCELCHYRININLKGMKPFWKWRQPQHLCDLVASLIIMYTLVMLLFLVLVTWIASRQCVSGLCITLYCLCFLAVVYFCYCCSYMGCMKQFWRGFLDVNRRWSIEGRQVNVISGKDNENII